MPNKKWSKLDQIENYKQNNKQLWKSNVVTGGVAMNWKQYLRHLENRQVTEIFKVMLHIVSLIFSIMAKKSKNKSFK